MPRSMLVGELLSANATNLPSEPALTTDDVTFTYEQLNRQVNRVASALLAAGVAHGDRVAVLSRNSAEYVEIYFAAAKIGAVLVPLNFWSRAAQHAFVLDDVEPALVFCSDEFSADIAAALTQAEGSYPTVPIPTIGEPAPQGWTDFVDRATTDAEPGDAVEPGDAHMIIYTSGTTGTPKGAVLSHVCTVTDAFAMAAVYGVRQSDRVVISSVPFHVGYWDNQKLFFLMGATVVLRGSFNAADDLAAYEKHRVTCIVGAPYKLSQVMADPTFGERDLSSVRLMWFGAFDPSGVMLRVRDAFNARTAKPVEMVHSYGLTEAGMILAACPTDKVLEHWGSIGRAVPGVELRLADDDGHTPSPGQPGEIWARGALMTEYWRRPRETGETLIDGWLHTGDMAVADTEGYLTVVDRKKDMIRSAGQNIYCKEIEDCLGKHPSVAEAAVIGVDDAVWEEAVCAIVVTRGDQLDADELRSWVRKHLAGYNVPKHIEFVDQLPKNTVGKVQKNALRDRFRPIEQRPGTRDDR